MKTGKKLLKMVSIVLIIVMVLTSFAGCSSEPISGPGENIGTESASEPTATPTDDKQKESAEKDSSSNAGTQGSSSSQDTDVEVVTPVAASEEPVTITFNSDGTYFFSSSNSFFSQTLELTLEAPSGAKIYYTLDGSEPDETDTLYTERLGLEPQDGSFPDAYIIRAKALLSDGTWSKTVAKTYFVAEDVHERYTTLVFSVSGEPAELTEKPEGIFTGKNYEQRGRESEREVYIEALNPDGSDIIAQFGGVRIYGGYSRQNSIKSMKLFARKSYDEDNKNFKFTDFGTPKLDGSDKIITKYDKLVLRDAGNDYQFCFLRDELSQTLCKNAGFEVYEAVLPAVAYLNGKYYGLFWLHESYSDKYLKEKFGDDAEGEFVIVEGSEQSKNKDDDELTQKYVDEFNTQYNKFIDMDLTNDANYQKLNEFMVVEDYLNFFAWNIALNNWDWPNNNYKCYRYVPAENDAKTDGVFDGRWRFLPHDMDYSYGLYGQDATQPFYDTLKVVTNPRDTRYAPLFTKLMERQDCRDYFYNKSVEFAEGVLSEDSIIESYHMLDDSRRTELLHYYDYLDQLRKKGDFTLWCNEYSYYESENGILTFAEKRPEYIIKYMNRYFAELTGVSEEEYSASADAGEGAGDGAGFDPAAGGFGNWGDMGNWGDFDWSNFDWSSYDMNGAGMAWGDDTNGVGNNQKPIQIVTDMVQTYTF